MKIERIERKPHIKTVICKILAIIMGVSHLSMLNPITADASTYTFEKPNITVVKPISLINGDFSSPKIGEALSQFPPNIHNVQYFIAANYSGAQVPGWCSIPTNTANVGLQYYNCIQYFSKKNGNGEPLDPTNNPDGQWVEVNGHFLNRLYQVVDTVPGTRVYWEFHHRAGTYYTNPAGNVVTSKDWIDVLNFGLRPAGDPKNPLTGDQIIRTSKSDGWQWYRRFGSYEVPAGQTQTEFVYEAVSAGSGINVIGNELTGLSFQTGSSLISEKAIFNSNGDRIDGGYGAYSDIITMRIKVTNWGETDAAPCVLTDELWDGLTFVSGEVTDGDVTGFLSEEDGVVTVNFGEGATESTGGTLKGSKSMGTSGNVEESLNTGKGQQAVIEIKAKVTGAPGSTIKNQSKITYNDKNYELENRAGLTAYSCIDYEKESAKDLGNPLKPGKFTMNILNPDGTVKAAHNAVDINNEETYVNQFTIVDRQINGTVWTDNDREDGMIGDSEKLLEGQTIWMQVKNNNGEWADAADLSGEALSTTTKADGTYSFAGILPGTYRVVMNRGDYTTSKFMNDDAIPVVVTAAKTQGSVDNDASKDGALAVVQELDFTKDVFTPEAHTYYAHNADIGLMPTVKAAVSKTVGEYVDKNIAFEFNITFKHDDGTFFAKGETLAYKGGVLAGSGATAPADGSIAIGDHGVGSIKLTHGQTITIAGISENATIVVAETPVSGCVASYQIDGGSRQEGTTSIDIAMEKADKSVAFLNEYMVTPTGVDQKKPSGFAPVVILFLCAAGGGFYFHKRRLQAGRGYVGKHS